MPRITKRTSNATVRRTENPWVLVQAALAEDGAVKIHLREPGSNRTMAIMIRGGRGPANTTPFTCNKVFVIGGAAVQCPASYKSQQLLEQHVQVAHDCQPFICNGCGRPFSDQANGNRHGHTCKPVADGTRGGFRCCYCHQVGNRKDNVKRHMQQKHPDLPPQEPEVVEVEQQPQPAPAVDFENGGLEHTNFPGETVPPFAAGYQMQTPPLYDGGLQQYMVPTSTIPTYTPAPAPFFDPQQPDYYLQANPFWEAQYAPAQPYVDASELMMPGFGG